MHLLADVLAMKLRLGYEIESETDFAAVVFSPSPRRWLGMRKGQDNQRFAIQIDEDGATNIERTTPEPHDSRMCRELGQIRPSCFALRLHDGQNRSSSLASGR